MRTIIHDLDNINFLDINDNDNIINNTNNNCIGCFNCWIRKPLNCIWKDDIKEIGKKLLDSDELIIISKCINGSCSSKVKKILERSISYVEPYFTIRDKEIHHKVRTNKQLIFKVFFYGVLSKTDIDTATKLVHANKRNLNTLNPEILFINDVKEIKL